MKKYKINNLSCASCASKIEEGVAKMEEVKFVSVNFANSSIRIDTNDMEKVKKKIKEIEAEVEKCKILEGNWMGFTNLL